MKVKNLIILILILTLAIISFNSCSNKKSSDKNTITFWHFWSEPNQKRVIDSLVKEFEKANHCTVEITELSWNDGKTKLFAAFNSGTAPDVLELGSDWVAQFSSSGVLHPLNTDSMEFSKYIDYSRAPSLWNGQIYAIPWIVDTRVLYYNRDILKEANIKQEAPNSFNEILANASKINSLENIYAYGAIGSDAHRLYKNIVIFFWSNGGDLFDSTGNILLNSPKNIQALDLYVQLARNGFIETQKQLDNAFAQGKIAYYISGAWLLDEIQRGNPSLDFGISLIPSIGNHQGVSFAGGEYISINAKTKNYELSKKFVKYLTDGKNAIEFCKQINEAGFPADKNFYNDTFYQSHPYRKVFAEQLNYAKMTPVHPKWLDMEAILENAAVKAMYGEQTSKDALDDAQMKVSGILLTKNK
ncbi:MAG TPA: extracellular solute-binding protein [Candidatus Kapabacteria bacterium]|jgi:multiple sugar transport system substrate-binding protein|nr:extracellular solute-binding protein [Candidatus Kapabacteria bacterium]HOV93160.1 extracellular solute-binding protein [Candidatus Kapabacteria bacterium]